LRLTTVINYFLVLTGEHELRGNLLAKVCIQTVEHLLYDFGGLVVEAEAGQAVFDLKHDLLFHATWTLLHHLLDHLVSELVDNKV